MGCPERLLLLRSLLAILGAAFVVAVIDLGSCRVMNRNCAQQDQAVTAASSAAAGWIGGVLTKHPEGP